MIAIFIRFFGAIPDGMGMQVNVIIALTSGVE